MVDGSAPAIPTITTAADGIFRASLPPLVEALHTSICEHLACLGLGEVFIERFQQELLGARRTAEDSSLFGAYRFAVDGVFCIRFFDELGVGLGTLEVSREATVAEVKVKLVERTAIPANCQHLVYKGRYLQNQEVFGFFVSPLDLVFKVVHVELPNIFAFGGTAAGEVLCSAETFDVVSKTWKWLPSMSRPRSHAVSLGSCVVALGHQMQPDASAEVYDTGANEWAPLPSMNVAIQDFQAVADDGHLYVIGGRSHCGVTSNALRLDAATRGWILLPAMGSARHSFAAVALGQRIYAIGGQGQRDADLESSEAFDVNEFRWVPLPPLPRARHCFATVAAENCVYAIGGACNPDAGVPPISSGIPLDNTDMFDSSDLAWVPLPAMATPRRACAALGINGRIFALGGTGKWGEALECVEALDTSSGCWTSCRPMSAPRKSFAAHSIGGKIYVFGGGDIAGGLSSAEVLDLAHTGVRVWAPLPTMAQPRGCIGASTVLAFMPKF